MKEMWSNKKIQDIARIIKSGMITAVESIQVDKIHINLKIINIELTIQISSLMRRALKVKITIMNRI